MVWVNLLLPLRPMVRSTLSEPDELKVLTVTELPLCVVPHSSTLGCAAADLVRSGALPEIAGAELPSLEGSRA